MSHESTSPTPPPTPGSQEPIPSGSRRDEAGYLDVTFEVNDCGFTRYHDVQTANAWRDAFR